MKLFLSALICVIMIACQYDPHAHRYTTRTPTREEAIGEYVLDQIYMEEYAPGIEDKIKSLPKPPTIHLQADGSCIAENFPCFSQTSSGFDYVFDGFQTIHCQWSLSEVGCVSKGSDKCETRYGISLSHQPDSMNTLGFLGPKQIDGLILGFGDPDSGNAILFRKSK